MEPKRKSRWKRVKLDGTRAKSNAGRPPVVTSEVIRKIEECAAIDASIEETLFYANISKDAYYDYLKLHPEFSERLERLRQKPVLAARQAVIKHSVSNYGNAMDYLKRKRGKEFGDKSEMTIRTPRPLLDALKKEETP